MGTTKLLVFQVFEPPILPAPWLTDRHQTRRRLPSPDLVRIYMCVYIYLCMYICVCLHIHGHIRASMYTQSDAWISSSLTTRASPNTSSTIVAWLCAYMYAVNSQKEAYEALWLLDIVADIHVYLYVYVCNKCVYIHMATIIRKVPSRRSQIVRVRIGNVCVYSYTYTHAHTCTHTLAHTHFVAYTAWLFMHVCMHVRMCRNMSIRCIYTKILYIYIYICTHQATQTDAYLRHSQSHCRRWSRDSVATHIYCWGISHCNNLVVRSGFKHDFWALMYAYLHVYVCMSIYIYIYIYTYIHTYICMLAFGPYCIPDQVFSRECTETQAHIHQTLRDRCIGKSSIFWHCCICGQTCADTYTGSDTDNTGTGPGRHRHRLRETQIQTRVGKRTMFWHLDVAESIGRPAHIQTRIHADTDTEAGTGRSWKTHHFRALGRCCIRC